MRLIDELLPRGRMTRSGFLIRHATVLPALLVLEDLGRRFPGPPWDLPVAVLATWLLGCWWARRLHDRGRSAAWLIALAVPLAGALWLAFECAVRGTAPGAPRYGPAPDAPAGYLVVRP